jgi:uncharacterized membrane protein YbaN (DUF454 family)
MGYFFLILGVIGIFVPLLPTTPFLLLSAGSFFRGSKKLYSWIINHKIFGSYIVNYLKHRAVTKRTKIFSILTLWLTIVATSVFFISFIWLKIMLFIIAIAVSVHILSLNTLAKEK